MPTAVPCACPLPHQAGKGYKSTPQGLGPTSAAWCWARALVGALRSDGSLCDPPRSVDPRWGLPSKPPPQPGMCVCGGTSYSDPLEGPPHSGHLWTSQRGGSSGSIGERGSELGSPPPTSNVSSVLRCWGPRDRGMETPDGLTGPECTRCRLQGGECGQGRSTRAPSTRVRAQGCREHAPPVGREGGLEAEAPPRAEPAARLTSQAPFLPLPPPSAAAGPGTRVRPQPRRTPAGTQPRRHRSPDSAAAPSPRAPPPATGPWNLMPKTLDVASLSIGSSSQGPHPCPFPVPPPNFLKPLPCLPASHLTGHPSRPT